MRILSVWGSPLIWRNVSVLIIKSINTFLRPKAKFKKKDGSETTVTNNNNHQNKRGKRTQLIQALDGKKARVAGLSKMVESYPQGSYYSNEIDPNALGLEMYNSEFNYEYPVSMDKVSRI